MFPGRRYFKKANKQKKPPPTKKNHQTNKQTNQPRSCKWKKPTDPLQGYKSFVQGWSGSKLKAKYGYKAIALSLLSMEQRKVMGKVIFALRTWLQVGCGSWLSWSQKTLVTLIFAPLEIWKFSPQAHLWDTLLWAQASGKDLFVNIAPPLAPGNSLCPAVLGPIAPMRASATGCLMQWCMCIGSNATSSGKVTRSYNLKPAGKLRHPVEFLQKRSPSAAYRALTENMKQCL